MSNICVVKNQEYNDLYERYKSAFGEILEPIFAGYVGDILTKNQSNALPTEGEINTYINKSEDTSETITYTPKGKQKQTYTVVDNKILNKDGKEVFKTDSVDRTKIFTNLAIKKGEAQLVTYKEKKYVVNKDEEIISVTTGKVMKWDENNGNRKAILALNRKEEVEEAPNDLDVVEQDNTLSDTLVLRTVLKGKDSAYTVATMKMMHYQFLKNLFNKFETNIEQLYSRKLKDKENKGLAKQIYDEVYNSVGGTHNVVLAQTNALIAEYNQTQDESLLPRIETGKKTIENLDYVSKNWSDVVAMHQKYLAQYNIDVANSDDAIKSPEEKDSTASWAETVLTISGKQTATTTTKLLMSSLPNGTIKDGVFTPKVNEYYRLPELLDFGQAWNVVANKLSNSNNIADIITKLEELSKEHPAGYHLKQKLFPNGQFNPKTRAELHKLLTFTQAMFKHKNDTSMAFLGKDGQVKIIDALQNNQEKRMVAAWFTNSKRMWNKPWMKTEGGVIKYNTDWFRATFGDFKGGVSATVPKHPDIFTFLPEQIELLNELKSTSPNKAKNLQIYMEHESVLRNLFGITLPPTKIPENIASFADTVDSIVSQIISNKALKNPTNEILSEEAKQSAFNILSDDSNFKNWRKPIIDHASKNSLDTVENNFLNAENKSQYTIQLYNYLTLLQDTVNSSATLTEVHKKLPHLKSTYSSDSLLMNSMGLDSKWHTKIFDSAGNRIGELRIELLDSLKNDETQTVVSNSKSTLTDKLNFSINASFQGVHSIFRPGDNSQERIHQGLRFVDNLKEDYSSIFRTYLNTEIKFFKQLLDPTEGEYKNATPKIERSLFSFLLKYDKTLAEKFNQVVAGDVEFSPADLDAFDRAFNAYINTGVDKTVEFLQNWGLLEVDGDRVNLHGIDSGLKLPDNSFAKTMDLGGFKNRLKIMTLNRAIWGIEQTKIFTGHPLFAKNADDFFKRMSAEVGTKNKAMTDFQIATAIAEFYPRVTKSSSGKIAKRLYYVDGKVVSSLPNVPDFEVIRRVGILDDVMAASKALEEIKKLGVKNNVAYSGMTESDAIGYITLDDYRDMYIEAGMWNDDFERLYQWENRPKFTKEVGYTNPLGEQETITEKDLLTAAGKRVMFPMSKPQHYGPTTDSRFIPAMYKLSLFPLLPSMTNEKVDGFPKYPNLTKLNDHLIDNNISILTFPSANKIGQKVVKGVTPQAYNAGNINVEDMLTQDTFSKYWGIQLYTGNTAKFDITGTQFFKIIVQNIYGGEQSPELIEASDRFFAAHKELVELGVEELRNEIGYEKGQPLNDKSVAKLTKVLRDEAQSKSAINNVLDGIDAFSEIYKENPVLDVLSNRDKIENILSAIATNRVIKLKLNGIMAIQAPNTFFELQKDGELLRKYADDGIQMLSNDLDFNPFTGTMEVYLPHRFKEYFGKDVDITSVSPELLEAIGFRIPTSGLNSIEHIIIKGFLSPNLGDVVILPSEIVAKAGSDFDVDKLNIILMNYAINKDTDAEYKFIKTTEGKAGLENKLLEAALDILRNQGKNRVNHIEPIGTTAFEKEHDRIIQLIDDAVVGGSFSDMIFDVVYQESVKERNLTSKTLTGPSALHTTDHTFAQIHDYFIKINNKFPLSFEEGSFNTTETGDLSLAKRTTVHGELISELLNQSVNAAVDGAKNPLFFNLNINLDTLNVIALMIRGGFGFKNIMTFINQPIIRDYVRGKSIEKSQSNQLSKYFKTNTYLKDKYGAYKGAFPTFQDMENMFKYDPLFNEEQNAILSQYKKLEEKANNVNDYIQASRLDTAGIGKNTSELSIRLAKIERVLANPDAFISNSDKVFTEGFLQPFYNGMKAIQEMYSPFFLVYKDKLDTSGREIGIKKEYNKLIQRLISNSKMELDKQVAVLDKFKSDYIAYLVLNHPMSFDNKFHGNVGKLTRFYMSGEDSVANRLLKASKESDNLILQTLQPVLGEHQISFYDKTFFLDTIKMFDQRIDVLEANSIVDAWRELFANPKYKELAQDLVITTLLQSGLKLSPITFTKFIPAEYYMDIVNKALTSNKNNPLSTELFLENFFFNNYQDENIVPTDFINPNASEDTSKKKLIFKFYPVKKEYQNLKSEQKQKLRDSGVNIYESKPVIAVNKKKDSLNIFNSSIFQDGTKSYYVEPQAIINFKQSQSLLSYTYPIKLRNTVVAINDVQFIPQNTTAIDETIDQTNFCKTK